MIAFKDLPPHHLVQRISEAELFNYIHQIGSDVAHDYAGMELTCLTVLWGAKKFNALSNGVIKSTYRRPKNIRHDVIRVESYGGRTESNRAPQIVLWPRHPEKNFRGKDVLIKDDIADTKLTLAQMVIPYVLSFNPNSIAVATMLTKSAHYDPIAAGVQITYHGPDINFFALGTGLDINQHYRNLKGIWELIWENPLS